MLRLTEGGDLQSTSHRVTILSTSQTTPWFRQFWPWFLISLPATAVIACIITIVIAVQNQPRLVNDNYYLEGLSINERLKQQQQAVELSVTANLLFAEQTGKISLYLNGDGVTPEKLFLSILAPGDTQLDQNFILEKVNQRLFSGALKIQPKGRFYVSLEPDHRDWLLLDEIILPSQDTVVIAPQSVD